MLLGNKHCSTCCAPVFAHLWALYPMGIQLFVLCTISLDTTFCTHAWVILFFFFFFWVEFLLELSLQISSRTAVSLQLNVIVFFSVFLWKVMLVGQLVLRACLYQSSRFFGYFVQGVGATTLNIYSCSWDYIQVLTFLYKQPIHTTFFVSVLFWFLLWYILWKKQKILVLIVSLM